MVKNRFHPTKHFPLRKGQARKASQIGNSLSHLQLGLLCNNDIHTESKTNYLFDQCAI